MLDASLLWERLHREGGLSYSWWYGGAVLPVAMVASCVFLFTWYTITRREESWAALVRWLALGTTPFILVLPSYYATVALPQTLDWIWEEPPRRVQDLSVDTLQTLASHLKTLAQFGLLGAGLALVLLVAGLLRLRYGPFVPGAARGASSNSTGDKSSITEIFLPPVDESGGDEARMIEDRHGVLKVMCGQRQENKFSVFPDSVIGKKNTATIIIPDRIVSGEHAAFLVNESQTLLKDLESSNGTYLRRGGPDQPPVRIRGNPVPLEHEDRIYLGHPSYKEAVEILFLHPR